ncbi:uncharacterized protein EV154DRAFT_440739 [Mucor mucedo]|uniref:uncharacterized protein n=1 Tax=Mucor mucedo TaxID=29922 RepID=UPI00221EB8B1|nr:uncharacterized protein EV154DRAFT_440739 [Mucor mucedo]KAI7892977.1 hypothetical protein EV154DRAFT_440739 [Mucor mucedo]
MTLPTYDQLPINPKYPKGTAWGVWGEDDNLGTLNHLTAERVANAAKCIKTGKRFPLNWCLEFPNPTFFKRETLEHHIKELHGGIYFDDYYDNFNTQTSSQWDGLRHFSHTPAKKFYNGITPDNIRQGTPTTNDRLGMQYVAEVGIVGRAVLLDYGRWAEVHNPSFDPFDRYEITMDELEKVIKYQNVTIEIGDILLLRTGWTARFEKGGPDIKGLSEADFPDCAGVKACEETYRWFWDHHIAAVATDAIPVEALPLNMDDCCHSVFIGGFGMMLGELFYLEKLAADSFEDKVYEYFFSSAPLNKKGGIASPPNAICIK